MEERSVDPLIKSEVIEADKRELQSNIDMVEEDNESTASNSSTRSNNSCDSSDNSSELEEQCNLKKKIKIRIGLRSCTRTSSNNGRCTCSMR